jgi:hypothetical protein
LSTGFPQVNWACKLYRERDLKSFPHFPQPLLLLLFKILKRVGIVKRGKLLRFFRTGEVGLDSGRI